MGAVAPVIRPAAPVRPTTGPAPATSSGTPTPADAAPIDRFEAPSTRPPIIIYIGPSDTRGRALAEFLRGQGQRVEIRDTARSPRAAEQLQTLLRERHEKALPLPVLDLHLTDMRPLSWDADVDGFSSAVWPWLAPLLLDATGTTPTREALPAASRTRNEALSSLRRPSGALPPARGIFGDHGARPLSSAFDQTLAAGANVGEGFARLFRGGNGAIPQLAAGVAQLPFTLAALPIAALESATQLALDGLVTAVRNAQGFAKVLLAVLLAIAAVILGPLRIVSFLLGVLIARPLSFVGQWLAERIGGPETSRTAFGVIPPELTAPRGNGFDAFERANDNPALADPEVWIRHHADAMNGSYAPPPPLIRGLMELREHDRGAYDRLRTELADAGIRCFYRFPTLALLQQTLRDRTATDDRPVALVVASPEDHNASFMTLSTSLSQLGATHRLVYVEAIDDAELAQAIARYGSARPISTLVIAGHGSEETTAFSETTALSGRGTLDVMDDTRFAPLRSFLADGAHVVLESCLTGAPNGLGEMLHRIWPQTIVHAPRDSDRNAGYDFDSHGRVIGARSFFGSMRTIE